MLKEYVARGTYIYPPRPSMRLITDIFAYCREHLPSLEHHLDLRLPHPRGRLDRGAGDRLHPRQRHRLRRGRDRRRPRRSTSSRPGCSFFWNAHNNFFEEVAKFRAARRMWAQDHDRAFRRHRTRRASLLRFHTQTGGSTLTAQQPENNIVRVTLQSLAAALGGTQSLHANGFDEALGLPTAKAARIALRTQQIIANESGVTDTVDPLAGSYFVESLTDAVEADAWAYLEKIDGWAARWRPSRPATCRRRSNRPPTPTPRLSTRGSKVIVGVNRFVDDTPEPGDVFPIDPALQAHQIERVRRTRAERDQAGGGRRPARCGCGRTGTDNLLPPMREALRRRATLGEVSDVLRAEFGVYQPSR